MTEQQLKAFAERTAELVSLPDFEGLQHRGSRLRRRRESVLALGAACLLVVAVAVTAVELVDSRDAGPARPVQQPTPSAELYFGSGARPALPAGTYEIPLTIDVYPSAILTTPPGWGAWLGPNRFAGPEGYVGVLVMDIDAVAVRPCRAQGERGMREVDDAAALVDALLRQPGHRVVRRPEPDDRFGYPGTRLRLRGTPAVRCQGEDNYELWRTVRGNYVQALGPQAVMDLWVVDLGPGSTALVSATWAAGTTPGWALRQLRDVIDSIEFVVR